MNTTHSSDASDIAVQGWIDRWAPPPLRPYFHLARLDRPIGTWLLLLPCWWSLALATPGLPDLSYLLLFGAGALVMRGAGCTINDLADREFDAQVARTATRPIASGAVGVFQALLFLALQLALGLLILLQFNNYTVWLSIASVGLIVLYPFMKRITYWPQAVLGLTFNWGALVGWSAEVGSLSTAPLLLYAAGFFWTLGYDTIYAHQDKADDILIGVKSTALKFGATTKLWLSGFYTVALVLIALAGFVHQLEWPFYAGLGLCALQLGWQIKTLKIDDPQNCLKRFKSNRDFGLILTAAIVSAQLL